MLSKSGVAFLLFFSLPLLARLPIAPHFPVRANDPEKIWEQLGIESYFDSAGKLRYPLDNVRVAVLDKGFKDADLRDPFPHYLPVGVEIIGKEDLDAEDIHGRVVAMALWAATGYQLPGKNLRLFSANGPESFAKAIKLAVHGDPELPEGKRWKANIIVHATTWPSHSTFVGDGEMNEAIAEAVRNNVIVINAAGNNGGLVYNGFLEFEKSEAGTLLKMKNGTTSLKFRNFVDSNPVTITASWGNTPNGTLNDLNVHLSDEHGTPIAGFEKQNKTQIVGEVKNRLRQTNQSRESIDIKLHGIPEGRGYRDYLISVSKQGGTFDANQFVRIQLKSHLKNSPNDKPSLKLFDATRDGELNAAGDGLAFVVGNLSEYSAKGPTMDGRGLPHALLEFTDFYLNDKDFFGGTTIAAAYMGGMVALMQAAANGKLRQNHLLQFREEFPYKARLNEGWKNQAAFLLSEPLIGQDLERATGKKFLWVKEEQSNKQIGLYTPLERLSTLASRVSKELLAKGDEYLHFLYVKKTSRNRTVLQPAYVNGLLTQVPVLIPERAQELKVYSVENKEGWQKPTQALGGKASDYFLLTQLKKPSIAENGIITDGTENDPRVFNLPSLTQVRRLGLGN